MDFQLSLVSKHASRGKLTWSGSAGLQLRYLCTVPTHPSPGDGGWRCESSASGLCCVWWWLGHQLCMTSAVVPVCRLRLAIPNCKWRLTFHLPAFPGHFQETKCSKTWCGHDHRVITEVLKLYWVHRYMYLCPSFSPTICFSGLKAAGYFIYLLLRADVPNSNHILLKNVRVVRGQMVTAFQSPLLFPPLNCRSRETTVVNRDLQNIQTYYRSNPSLSSFSCLFPLLKTPLAMLLLQPGTGAEVQTHQLWTLRRC